MRGGRTVVVSIAIFVAAATTAGAGAGRLDPLRLALHRPDMPKSVEKSFLPSPSAMNPADVAILGVPGTRAAHYSYTWPAGGTVNVPALGPTPKEWHLEGTVFVATGTGAA